MTVDTCVSFCNSGNYVYAGVENGGECYCGNSFEASSSEVSADSCSSSCPGVPGNEGAGKQVCGGKKVFSLWSQHGVAPVWPSTVASVGKFFHAGCITEGTTKRAFDGGDAWPWPPGYIPKLIRSLSFVDPNRAELVNSTTMTVEVCGAFCAKYRYFGVEYGSEVRTLLYFGDTFFWKFDGADIIDLVLLR
jgi:WSC domain